MRYYVRATPAILPKIGINFDLLPKMRCRLSSPKVARNKTLMIEVDVYFTHFLQAEASSGFAIHVLLKHHKKTGGGFRSFQAPKK